MSLSRSSALAELVAQHDALRALMTGCEMLADEIDAGRGDPAALIRELGRLRESFETHNTFEERLLRPVLLAEDTHGSVRVERMVEDHLNEHAEMRTRLASPVTAELRDVIETLRAHLEAEERYLLTAKVLREPAAEVRR
ncbi:MAG: hemerythrin domain-containing protein [Myxococcales bacterium]|nr:hemerythrin domain-containing protein [Myxococcales bacterium]